MKFCQNWPKRSSKWIENRPSLIMSWLGGRAPRLWASIYIFMIPFTGFVFWALPAGSFYDSNLIRETGFKHDLVDVARLLTSAIQAQEYGVDTDDHLADTWKTSVSDWVLDRNSVSVVPGSIAVESSGDITLTIQGHAASASLHGLIFPFIDTVTLSNSADGFLHVPIGSLAKVSVSLTTSRLANSEPAPLDNLLPDLGVGPSTSATSLLLMPSSTELVYQRLSAAGQGDPKEASGLYIRMCYFSATTITTLGFGDITPVSSLSRILVAAEAVLGVVLIGLFLNSVAQKWGKGS